MAGDYPDMFQRLFASQPDIELVPYDLTQGRFPASPDACDGWITTGSRLSVYDDIGWIEDFGRLVQSIAETERRFVGVCFGHQMIAHALGGKVERAANGWGIGLKEVAVPEPPSWWGRERYRVLNSHADQVVDLPPGAAVLGGNDHCPVSLMTTGDTMLGIQGHPEFPPAYAAALIRARRGVLIAEEVSAAGLASLSAAPDTEFLAGALGRFLRGS